MTVTDDMVAAAASVLRADIEPAAWPTDDEVRFALEAALAAAPQGEPVQEIAWMRVIDEAMVTHHLGVAAPADDYETAKRKMNNLLCMAQDIGTYFAKQAAAPQWIACSKRMPADCETVLVASQAATSVIVAYVGTDGQWRNLLTGTAVIYPVSHWMPLPAAPGSER